MGETRAIIEELLALCLQRISIEENSQNTELEMLEVVRTFEAVRKRWLHAELELKKYKELLVKSDVAKAALEVKLKHARNQLDVEMKKRYKVEADYQYLQRQMQLMCDILVHDSKSSACLNEEQKSLLATFEHRGGGNVTVQRSNKRLSAIDESSFLSHSDISYDRTDDDLDLNAPMMKPLRSRARERRRSSMGPILGVPPVKRGRGSTVTSELTERKTVEKEVEMVVKASVRTPDLGAQSHMVVGITQQETLERPVRTVSQECAVSLGGADETSVWFPGDETMDTMAEPESEAAVEPSVDVKAPPAGRAEKIHKHVFVSKTVIRPEMCQSCGKRIRFGKMAVKCRNCRTVAHPECKLKFTSGCSVATPTGSTAQDQVPQDSLERFAPVTHPRVPRLIADCVAEIERRGLDERGLYRVPGGERPVKELRERFLQGKTPLVLSKVSDIHVVCGLLKDFLRKLREPLITFRLHRTFMEASELPDEDNSSAVMFQAIAELPKANRDTLAFLMLHLHKVIRSPRCQMDQNNLARVFGPTIIGHGMSEPSPNTIMRDTNTQPKVVCRFLSLPEDYWRRVLAGNTEPTPSSNKKTLSHDEGLGPDRLFQPLTSPEINSHQRSQNSGTVRGRIRNMGNAFTNTTRVEPGKRFFTSPS
ncbi:rac GTPase-activating protein 1 [Cynoglossus semilaevis]|uniref:rac GTPase-activating protein 1 n=1 Tax=Cynoglossus semilaevis TaxID=244447 RepID=UPI0007DCAEFC|nr:rac GTPase-activating protein 1-like [Cynoglossus semilaevis]XP_024913620.1 rac GTPase-activating protein 1-like [Cynoglossus semilaevis]XP_024913621.1 rac GTPase-activating protein 1-like [Cynoglossus semilaevis]XP_024913622.1 rac GTPase-activating protein 1-like [Cynoglossus semilaevis]XP_024913623.1 rac GTPase-activating protein 1-like [Cynoglossus semilaevis]XP_024913624.1 rac GTPase-activating protein 1-like [Cynoglossus semilaevis]XP_024913625.1 rac GTPase-activating protein 1-like [